MSSGDPAPLRPSEDMKALMKEDARIHGELKKLEQQIYALETNYLESTSQAGNLVRGWGDLLTTNQKNQKKKRVTVADEDRIFSLSSSTSMENTDGYRRSSKQQAAYSYYGSY
eukprot:TRINITY_DN9672_c0_g1_i1.p1 TRINITY_DN9672_c0_g1~~TRINITY_DN9672_c0_g1_i1.p1  ORF type:complete len:113 (-),score=25.81 TRINITY_DN9672_c0_g1_i1:174-512(-)